MKLIYIICITLLPFFASSQNTAPFYNVLDYGVSEKNELNTVQFQAAIDACYQANGGTVYVPAGTYVIGTLFLKSNVNLNLAADATLLGSTNLDDYANVEKPVEAPRYAKCLIHATDQKNISITGSGTINGRGSEENFDHWGERPMLIRFTRCKDVRIEGVKLMNSASWNTHLIECERVNIDKIHLYNRMQGNNDGIDFDSCKDVFISNSKFDTEDDPICGKSTLNKSCENIVITNCVIKSNCSGFKLGTSSKGTFRNITMTNCIIRNTGRGAVKLICVDGGVIDGVNISNIVMDSVQGPFFIRLGDRGKTYETAKDQDYSKEGADAIDSTPVGQIKNITISNIQATILGKDTIPKHSENQSGVMISGLPGHYIENLKISNVTILYPGGGTLADAQSIVPEDSKRYPEQSFFGTLPSYAFYARHVKGIYVSDWVVKYNDTEQRPAIFLDDVKDSQFDLFRVMSPSGGSPLIRKTGTDNVLFNEIRSINQGTTEIINTK